MSIDGLATYDEIARWLPVDVVEAIGVSAPCAKAVVHLWDWTIGYDAWRCSYCGLVSHTDPRPRSACAQRGHHTWRPDGARADFSTGGAVYRDAWHCTTCDDISFDRPEEFK